MQFLVLWLLLSCCFFFKPGPLTSDMYISEIEKKCLPGPESLPAKLAVCELILTCMGVVSNFFAQTTQFQKYVYKIKMCSKFSHFKGH